MPHPTEVFLLCDRYLKGLRKILGQGFHPSDDISFLVREGITIRTPDEISEYRNKEEFNRTEKLHYSFVYNKKRDLSLCYLCFRYLL